MGNDHFSLPAGPGRAFGAVWLVTAAWAHPLWQQYEIALYDLTTETDDGPPILYLEGATHEVVVHALHPDFPLDRLPRPGETPNDAEKIHHLIPPNHAYQFVAESDAAAEQRIQEIVDGINAGMVSPDTDFRRDWDFLFRDDGRSLTQSRGSGATAIHSPLDGSPD
jgi:hypothetical protein